MSYPELLHAFKLANITDVEEGTDIDMASDFVLLSGSVSAFVPTPQPLASSLRRKANTSALRRESHMPTVAPGDSPAREQDGKFTVVSAPALLSAGTYPAKANCTVRCLCSHTSVSVCVLPRAQRR